MAATLTILIYIATIGVAVAKAAPRWPTSRPALLWHPDPHWLHDALCIHNHESVNWHRAGIDWKGNPSPYYGGLQFLISTWRTAGGTRLPSDWSPREQLYRAWRIWSADNGSWHEWGTAKACGLR